MSSRRWCYSTSFWFPLTKLTYPKAWTLCICLKNKTELGGRVGTSVYLALGALGMPIAWWGNPQVGEGEPRMCMGSLHYFPGRCFPTVFFAYIPFLSLHPRLWGLSSEGTTGPSSCSTLEWACLHSPPSPPTSARRVMMAC